MSDTGFPDLFRTLGNSDGAEWIRNTCDELFGGGGVTYVLDASHALEYASAAVRAIHPDVAERERRFVEVRSDIEEGRAAQVVRELEPFSGLHEDVAACVRHFRGNLDRMRYDEYRSRGIQVGSGVVEGGCRQYGRRLKRSGTRWSTRGANVMLAPRTLAMNLGVPDFLDWRANQVVAA